MFEKMRLEGMQSMANDLQTVLKNEHCLSMNIEKDDTGKIEQTYQYECGSIQVCIDGIDESDYSWQLKPGWGGKIPSWFTNLTKYIVLVWHENMGKSIIEHAERLVKESKEGMVGYKRSYAMYQKTNELKVLVGKIFEKQNWIIPHYIEWNVAKTVLHAVMIDEERNEIKLDVNGELKKNVIDAINFDDFSTDYENILAINLKKG